MVSVVVEYFILLQLAFNLVQIVCASLYILRRTFKVQYKKACGNLQSDTNYLEHKRDTSARPNSGDTHGPSIKYDNYRR